MSSTDEDHSNNPPRYTPLYTHRHVFETHRRSHRLRRCPRAPCVCSRPPRNQPHCTGQRPQRAVPRQPTTQVLDHEPQSSEAKPSLRRDLPPAQRDHVAQARLCHRTRRCQVDEGALPEGLLHLLRNERAQGRVLVLRPGPGQRRSDNGQGSNAQLRRVLPVRLRVCQGRQAPRAL